MDSGDNNGSVDNNWSVNMKSGKRVRQDLTPYESTLKEFWQRGMIRAKGPDCQRLIKECCLLSGLEEATVKNWISNQKKKEERLMKNQLPTNTIPSGIRQKCAKDMFFREIIPRLDVPSSQQLKEANRKWMAVKDCEGEKYAEAAKAVNEQLASRPEAAVREVQLKKLYRKMTNMMDDMHRYGEEVLVLSFNRSTGKYRRFGTELGQSFGRQNKQLEVQFLSFIGNDNRDDVDTLRQKVVDLFNRKCALLTGLAHCSYSEVRKGCILVSGLPDGVKFDHPATMGRKKLLQLLQCSGKLAFTRPTLTLDEPSALPNNSATSAVVSDDLVDVAINVHCHESEPCVISEPLLATSKSVDIDDAAVCGRIVDIATNSQSDTSTDCRATDVCSTSDAIKSTLKTGVSKRKRAVSHTVTKRPKVEKAQPESDNNTSVDDTPCMYCEVAYCNSTVSWIQCRNCNGWACGSCISIGKKTTFYCSSCKPN